jgi:membrane associated rhomboid family serine protease
MLIIPYSSELGLAKRPIVTYAIIAICLAVHYFQEHNRERVNQSLYYYCKDLYNPALEANDIDFLSTNINTCFGFLGGLHSQPNKTVTEAWIREENEQHQSYTEQQLSEVIALAQDTYNDFARRAPASLDAKLMYDPSSWNPIRTITSALSHGDWMHVIGNLIFFFAFAAAIEILLASSIHYLGFMLLIALTADTLYSISILLSNAIPIPSLGLSGVVSGVIGLSAFLMPQARIKTFVWLIAFFKIIPIPAWILAAWFIGWDAYYLLAYSEHGGVNLLAHVSGGVAGYLYGFLFLKGRKEEIQDELDDEIEYMKSIRNTRLGMSDSYKGGEKYLQHIRERDAKREYAAYTQQLYRLVNSDNNSQAINLFLKDYDHYEHSVEVYEELFHEMDKWRACRALFCLGRLTITLLLENRENKKALTIAKRCLDLQNDFVLANPLETIKLTLIAIDLQLYQLAYQLIRRADLRYGEHIDLVHAMLLEAKLLLLHLHNREEAKNTLKRLVATRPVTHKEEIASLIQMYKHGN